jgi:hypothetical protein
MDSPQKVNVQQDASPREKRRNWRPVLPDLFTRWSQHPHTKWRKTERMQGNMAKIECIDFELVRNWQRSITWEHRRPARF